MRLHLSTSCSFIFLLETSPIYCLPLHLPTCHFIFLLPAPSSCYLLSLHIPSSCPLTFLLSVPSTSCFLSPHLSTVFLKSKFLKPTWPRRVHGRRTDPPRPPLRRTCAEKTSHRQTTAAIQSCVQEGPKSPEHRPEQLGSNSPQTVSLETDCAARSLQVRRDTRSAPRGKENEKKGCSPCKQASVRLRLCPLPLGLSFPHRTGQPRSTLYQNKHLERNSIVLRD